MPPISSFQAQHGDRPVLRNAFQYCCVGLFVMALAADAHAGGQWPQLVELDIGESAEVKGTGGKLRVTLQSAKETTEPDYFIANNPSRTTVARADVVLDVGGTRAELVARPYQLPVVVNGVRLYVEMTRGWAGAHVQPLREMKKAVRLAWLDARETWGPPDFVFPIENYRWRSGTYNNTWGSLVPYNLLYYHRGEDLGAIPERLPVVAVFSGTIAQSPHEGGKPHRSNHVAIRSPDGMVAVYGHMNFDTIEPNVVIGAAVKAGQVIGRTGDTWNGARNQHSDPHLHVGIHAAVDATTEGRPFAEPRSFYPMLVAAYLRKFPDKVLAVAGGYHFGIPGQTIRLDATRSVAREGEEIESYEWRLHDGTRVSDAAAKPIYDGPGLYSEELIVRTRSGAEDRDYAQVRIYDPKRRPAKIGHGWFYHFPVRGIRPNTPVLFWNRLETHAESPTWIDFGDGAPRAKVGKEITHAYAKPGTYTAVLSANGPENEPLTVKMRVVVEP